VDGEMLLTCKIAATLDTASVGQLM
jgi:hypothetical protein